MEKAEFVDDGDTRPRDLFKLPRPKRAWLWAAWRDPAWRAGFVRGAILFFLLGAALAFVWRQREFARMREDLKQPINEKVRDHHGVPR